MPRPEETRKVKRISTKIPLTFKVHPSMEKDITLIQREVSTHAVDMSIIGIGIKGSVYVPEGTLLSIQLEGNLIYPQRKNQNNYVNIVGEVTSAKMEGGQYRLGILFKELSDQDKAAIKKFVETAGE